LQVQTLKPVAETHETAELIYDSTAPLYRLPLFSVSIDSTGVREPPSRKYSF